MADLGISGKRVRKKPKYLRDDEEEDEEDSPLKQSKSVKPKKSKRSKEKASKRSSKKNQKSLSTRTGGGSGGIKLKIKFAGKSSEKRRAEEDSIDSFDAGVTEDSDNIDIEGETVSSLSMGDEQDLMIDDFNEPTSSITPDQQASSKSMNDDTSDEEREWLDAIESGDIEDYEKKRAERNPALLTARQRRLLHGEEEEQLIELPTQYKNKALTEEQLNVRKQRAVKRRQQALEKSERAKKQTVDRLLNKSEKESAKTKAKSSKQACPHVRLVSSKDSLTLSLPQGVEFPLQRQAAREAPAAVLCVIKGCKNMKKYNCSKTSAPLCSLECYKANLAGRTKTPSRPATVST